VGVLIYRTKPESARLAGTYREPYIRDAMHAVRRRSRLALARRGWPVLAASSCIAIAACRTGTEVDTSAPTPWEIQPAATVDDGTTYWPAAQWRTALPNQVGMDGDAMAALSRDMQRRRWETLRSLLIVHRGYLVFNEYVVGTTPQQLQPLHSMTATVTGLLAGIAVREDKLHAIDGVRQLFPEYSDFGGPFTSGMVVDDLLSMRSGISIDEEIFGSAAPTTATVDWLRLIFSRPMMAMPGETWHYSSADAVILGGVLRATTGEAANAYARRTLFASLGITDYTWYTGQPNGLPQMGSGLSLTAPDMARIGYLLLRKGQWQGTQLVTPAWVAGMGERKSEGVVRWLQYSLDFGRMLWVLPAFPGGPATDAVAGTGIRGQWIIVVPSRDLVVVATGAAQTVDEHAEVLRLLYDVIVPAIR